MEADQTRINDKPPELHPELRNKEKAMIFGELSPNGELVLREAGLSSVPSHMLGDVWESVLQLDLRDNAISSLDTLPADKLQHIQILDARNNKIDTIPDFLPVLTPLLCLRLDKNHISALPPDIGNLQFLEVLSIAFNQLSFLPLGVCKMQNLKTLAVNDNNIQYLPPQLGELTNLRVLHIHKNCFAELPLSFSQLEGLKEFSLEWFRYTSPPLPRILKGHIGEAMIGSLRALCSKLYINKEQECSLLTFLHHFSEEEFDMNYLDSKKRSIMHVAASEGDAGVIKGLINADVDVDVLDKDGYSPLLSAIKEEHTECVKLLLQSGVEVNEGGGPLGSPLHLACFKVKPWLVRDLVKRGADINSQDCEGNSPLHIILGVFNKCNYKSQVIAEILIESGAHVNCFNNERWAPIHLASRRGQTEAIAWVLHENAVLSKSSREIFDINLQGGSHYWTPLHLAGHAGHFEIVQMLVETSAQLFIRNSDGRTPRQSSKGDLALFKYLIRAEKEVLKHQNYQTWASFEQPEEVKVASESPVHQVLKSSNPIWKRYTALYELFEKGKYEELAEIFDKVENTNSIKAECLYLMSQLKKKIEVSTSSTNLLVIEEAKYASYSGSN